MTVYHSMNQGRVEKIETIPMQTQGRTVHVEKSERTGLFRFGGKTGARGAGVCGKHGVCDAGIYGKHGVTGSVENTGCRFLWKTRGAAGPGECIGCLGLWCLFSTDRSTPCFSLRKGANNSIISAHVW